MSGSFYQFGPLLLAEDTVTTRLKVDVLLVGAKLVPQVEQLTALRSALEATQLVHCSCSNSEQKRKKCQFSTITNCYWKSGKKKSEKRKNIKKKF